MALEIETTTTLAIQEKQKLRRTLRRLDMVLFTICALVGLDTLGKVSSYGPQTFAWLLILSVTFLAPYALIMSELGTAFPQEGGPYEWVKLAFGRFAAAITAILYWITNPLWVGGSLAFIATQAWSDNIHPIGSATVGDYLFKLVFIWFSIGVAIASLRHGKWIPNAGAVLRFAVLGFFSVTIVLYAIDHGLHGYSAGDFSPSSLTIFLGLVPLLLFNYVGFELQNGAAEEMENPQRDVPVAVLRSALATVALYGIPILGILTVLPLDRITGIDGFIAAVNATFSVYGSAGHFLSQVMAVGAIVALLTSGAVWMIGSDRIQAVAAYDGGFGRGFFGVFNDRLGTPVRVNLMSGVTATLFMIAAQQLLTGSTSAANTFNVVLYLATSTTLLSYLLIFPAVIKLRSAHPGVHRPYRVPFGKAGVWICGGACTAWMALGSWVAVAPGYLERLFGIDYSVADSYGVSRARFEVFTLGTLAVILAWAVIAYVRAQPVRERIIQLPLQPVVATDPTVAGD